MNYRGALFVASVLFMFGCSSAPPPDGEAVSRSSEALWGNVTLTENDNGKGFIILAGNEINLTLPSDVSTGYSWDVTSTDAHFGPPVMAYVENPSGVPGAVGAQTFTWKTNISQGGRHTVTLAYKRPWESEVAKTFSFMANVIHY